MGLFTPDFNNLRDLYKTEVQRQLSSEAQAVEALDSMAEKASAPALANAFRQQTEKAKEHASRLERILDDAMGEHDSSKCKITAALISGAESDANGAAEGHLRDVVLIASGNQLVHHQIAVYGTLQTWASILGEGSHAKLLEKSLQELKGADQALVDLAAQINVTAPVG